MRFFLQFHNIRFYVLLICAAITVLLAHRADTAVILAVTTTAQAAMTYVPELQAVFGTASVPLLDGMLVIAIGVALLAVVETEKQIRLHLHTSSVREVNR